MYDSSIGPSPGPASCEREGFQRHERATFGAFFDRGRRVEGRGQLRVGGVVIPSDGGVRDEGEGMRLEVVERRDSVIRQDGYGVIIFSGQ